MLLRNVKLILLTQRGGWEKSDKMGLSYKNEEILGVHQIYRKLNLPHKMEVNRQRKHYGVPKIIFLNPKLTLEQG